MTSQDASGAMSAPVPPVERSAGMVLEATTESLAELARVTDLQWHLFREYDAKRGAR